MPEDMARLATGPSQVHRVAGGLVDRSRRLNFRFDGQSFVGHQGDTLASALLANGVRLVARSFKYHRPRGILSSGPEEPNALVELRGGAHREPNTRATVAELYDGLEAVSQNRFPSLKFDVMAVNNLLSPIFAAGFYYKTFMWPAAFWERVYEPLIRRAAGLGRASGAPDPDRYEKEHAFCDVLVIGGGAAGLMAAQTAGRSGARVILCDEDFLLGGRLLAERDLIGALSGPEWVARMEAELRAMPDVTILSRTTVFGAYDDGSFGAVERVADHLPSPLPGQPRQRLWKITARTSVVAAGAIERPLVFGNNDRPGVMLAGAVRSYVNRYAVAPGRRAVVFANNDDAARTMADLAQAGIAVAAYVDPREDLSDAIRQMAAASGATILAGAAVIRAIGRQAVREVEIRQADGELVRVACDLVAMSGGWSPTVHLTTGLGGRPVWNDAIAAFAPGRLPRGMVVAGAAGGRMSRGACLATGAEAGAKAAAEAGFEPPAILPPNVEPESGAMQALWRVRGSRGKSFIDFQNDVSTDDIAMAEREGFTSVEHMKRYTTAGMATDQGKTANVNALALMAELTERSIAETGTTTFRPPYTPVALGALAGPHRGRDFRPTRLTPSHDWASEHSAVFVESGLWLRAQYFPRDGEADWQATVDREVRAVRAGVGLCDVTTLGKIDIQGADAAIFLDRVYANTMSTLRIGRVRYGLMLREDGFVMDDGTVARLSDDHFLMTTTTANAVGVMQHLEFCHQCLWPGLDVQMVSVTEQWAQFSIAGPRARDTLADIVDSQFDISDAAVPYMGAAAVTVCGGITARLFRISFSGELAYEIAVPARFGDALVRRLMAAGAAFGITPYGTEALGVMRVEKGHPAGGELNGQTTAHDLGMARLLSRKKDFVGRAMAARPALNDPARPALVGLRPLDPRSRLRAGAHLLPPGAEAVIGNDQGYVTSVVHSPMLDQWIGLAMLAGGPARTGETIRAYDPVRNGDLLMQVVSPVFFDPAGERLRG